MALKISMDDKIYTIRKEFTFKYWKNAITRKMRPTKAVLIEMMHTNGTVSHHIVPSDMHKFRLKGYVYIIDEEAKVNHTGAGMYMYRYHENFALPLRWTIDKAKLIEALPDEKTVNEIQTSYNPYVLVDVLKMEYAKGVLAGAEVSDHIKRIMIIALIGVVVSIGHLALHAFKAGWI